MKVVDIDELKQHLRYDAETGRLFWRKVEGSRIRVREGKPAGCRQKDNYIYVDFRHERFLAHRVAWALHYGYWPTSPIDHIDMDRGNNRIANLRLASVTENNRNRTKQSNNTSGYKGVTFYKATGKYQAKIAADGKVRTLGSFETPQDAHAAYLEAAKELHGEYARA